MEPTRVTMLMRGEKLFRNIERGAARALSGCDALPKRSVPLLLSSNKTVGVHRGEK